jgi:hypothetical protein
MKEIYRRAKQRTRILRAGEMYYYKKSSRLCYLEVLLATIGSALDIGPFNGFHFHSPLFVRNFHLLALTTACNIEWRSISV